jgi:hypothetical protein
MQAAQSEQKLNLAHKFQQWLTMPNTKSVDPLHWRQEKDRAKITDAYKFLSTAWFNLFSNICNISTGSYCRGSCSGYK